MENIGAWAIYVSELCGEVEFIEVVCVYKYKVVADKIAMLLNNTYSSHRKSNLDFFCDKYKYPPDNLGFDDVKAIYNKKLLEEELETRVTEDEIYAVVSSTDLESL